MLKIVKVRARKSGDHEEKAGGEEGTARDNREPRGNLPRLWL